VRRPRELLLRHGGLCAGALREMHEQHRAMAEAPGDRTGVARACCNLGNCH